MLCTLPLFLILPIFCKNLLLLFDQRRRGYQFFRRIRVVRLLFGELLLLVSNLPNGMPSVKLFGLLFLQNSQSVAHSDDL